MNGRTSGIVLDLERTGTIDWSDLLPEARRARERLEAGTGPSAELTGWLDLPAQMNDEALAAIEGAAARIRATDALVVAGIGGSYLGARALIDALAGPDGFEVLFAGNSLDAAYHQRLLQRLSGRRYSVDAVSKSGGTIEPSIALRLLLADLEARLPREQADQLIYATTGPSGALAELADSRGWTVFPIPDGVGGRFSVLSAVGLLPAAAAGCDIRAIVAGARSAMEILRDPENSDALGNPALAYAAFRQAAYRSGRKVEALLTCAPSLASLAGWWQQLFGESEGKDKKGALPQTIDLTTDLHSLGQWLQDGEPIAFETAIDAKTGHDLEIPSGGSTGGGPDHVAGKQLHTVNRAALAAALEAHADRGTPCLRIEIPEIAAGTIGALLYFFEYSCAISGYMLGVDPFDQPGVEAYKRNMRRLLEESD
jgi:glucose-6-phosphate isomerase